ncbi:MAG: hypothetical protein WA268_19940 [Xanthobacteraceae bacterium]
MTQTSNPFPPYRPSQDSPLSQVKRDHSGFVTVTNMEEQRRAEGIPEDMRSGRLAPTFDEVETPAPFTETTPVPRIPKS